MYDYYVEFNNYKSNVLNGKKNVLFPYNRFNIQCLFHEEYCIILQLQLLFIIIIILINNYNL